MHPSVGWLLYWVWHSLMTENPFKIIQVTNTETSKFSFLRQCTMKWGEERAQCSLFSKNPHEEHEFSVMNSPTGSFPPLPKHLMEFFSLVQSPRTCSLRAVRCKCMISCKDVSKKIDCIKRYVNTNDLTLIKTDLTQPIKLPHKTDKWVNLKIFRAAGSDQVSNGVISVQQSGCSSESPTHASTSHTHEPTPSWSVKSHTQNQSSLSF